MSKANRPQDAASWSIRLALPIPEDGVTCLVSPDSDVIHSSIQFSDKWILCDLKEKIKAFVNKKDIHRNHNNCYVMKI